MLEVGALKWIRRFWKKNLADTKFFYLGKREHGLSDEAKAFLDAVESSALEALRKTEDVFISAAAVVALAEIARAADKAIDFVMYGVDDGLGTEAADCGENATWIDWDSRKKVEIALEVAFILLEGARWSSPEGNAVREVVLAGEE